MATITLSRQLGSRGDEVAQAIGERLGYRVVYREAHTLIEDIADLVKAKRIEGIRALRDESDRTGMRIVMELKRDALPQVVLNQLYKHTALQTTFGVILLSIVQGLLMRAL